MSVPIISARSALGLAAVGALAAAAQLATAEPASADGIISDTEYAYVTTWGPTAVCPTIDAYPTKAGVFGVMAGIMDDGFAADAAVDIINESVSTYCPRHWALLVRIGDEARAQNNGPTV